MVKGPIIFRDVTRYIFKFHYLLYHHNDTFVYEISLVKQIVERIQVHYFLCINNSLGFQHIV